MEGDEKEKGIGLVWKDYRTGWAGGKRGGVGYHEDKEELDK